MWDGISLGAKNYWPLEQSLGNTKIASCNEKMVSSLNSDQEIMIWIQMAYGILANRCWKKQFPRQTFHKEITFENYLIGLIMKGRMACFQHSWLCDRYRSYNNNKHRGSPVLWRPTRVMRHFQAKCHMTKNNNKVVWQSSALGWIWGHLNCVTSMFCWENKAMESVRN